MYSEFAGPFPNTVLDKMLSGDGDVAAAGFCVAADMVGLFTEVSLFLLVILALCCCRRGVVENNAVETPAAFERGILTFTYLLE